MSIFIFSHSLHDLHEIKNNQILQRLQADEILVMLYSTNCCVNTLLFKENEI